MKRNVEKSVNEYRKKYYYNPKRNKKKFEYLHMSEVSQIMEMSREPLDAMAYSFEHGFMIGYKAALRDLKAKEGIC